MGRWGVVLVFSLGWWRQECSSWLFVGATLVEMHPSSQLAQLNHTHRPTHTHTPTPTAPPHPPTHRPQISHRRHLDLLEGDQLLRQARRCNVFVGLAEGPVTFLPTYKFEKGALGLMALPPLIRFLPAQPTPCPNFSEGLPTQPPTNHLPFPPLLGPTLYKRNKTQYRP